MRLLLMRLLLALCFTLQASTFSAPSDGLLRSPVFIMSEQDAKAPMKNMMEQTISDDEFKQILGTVLDAFSVGRAKDRDIMAEAIYEEMRLLMESKQQEILVLMEAEDEIKLRGEARSKLVEQ